METKEDPRKEICVQHNHYYSRWKIDCAVCEVYRECWVYTGKHFGL